MIWEIVARYLTASSFSVSSTLLHLYFCVSLIMKEKYFLLSKVLLEQNYISINSLSAFFFSY